MELMSTESNIIIFIFDDRLLDETLEHGQILLPDVWRKMFAK